MNVVKNGVAIEYSDFQPKKSNLIKTRLQITKNFPAESIWACLSDEDFADYKNGVVDQNYRRMCILQNDALVGLPWGTFVPVRLRGDGEIPESDCADLTGDIMLSEFKECKDE